MPKVSSVQYACCTSSKAVHINYARVAAWNELSGVCRSQERIEPAKLAEPW